MTHVDATVSKVYQGAGLIALHPLQNIGPGDAFEAITGRRGKLQREYTGAFDRVIDRCSKVELLLADSNMIANDRFNLGLSRGYAGLQSEVRFEESESIKRSLYFLTGDMGELINIHAVELRGVFDADRGPAGKFLGRTGMRLSEHAAGAIPICQRGARLGLQRRRATHA